MHIRSLALPAAILLFACGSPQHNPDNAAPEKKAAADTAVLNITGNTPGLQAYNFSEIDSSGILLFPLVKEGERSRTKSSYESGAAASYWNILFYNTKTGEQYLLDERKMLIYTYSGNTSAPEAPVARVLPGHIFYSITSHDFNADKQLNQEDPVYLFVTGKDGKNFRQVSPEGCMLRQWQYIKTTGKLLMMAVKDSDGNKKFDEADEVAVFETDLSSNTPPVEVFQQPLKNKLKQLYQQQWGQSE